MGTLSALETAGVESHRERKDGTSSSQLTLQAQQEIMRRFSLDLSFHRLCALSGIPQKLVNHPSCGPARLAHAICTVRNANGQSFRNVLNTCLDKEERNELYDRLQAGDNSSHDDHARYAEVCREHDRLFPLRFVDAIRQKIVSVPERSPSHPSNIGLIETLVDTAVGGVPINVVPQEIIDCLNRSAHGHFEEVLPDADDFVPPPRRNGSRNSKGDTGNHHHGNRHGRISLTPHKVTSTEART